jgi:ABC-2 type transport system ATP-binding protein
VGQRQKLSILLALGHRPDVLILDEPVASLDPIARRQFLEQIVDIAAGGVRSVVFSSHIVSDVERLANKIWILKDGRLSWQGELDTLKESIVRVHIRNVDTSASDFRIPNALSLHREDQYVCAVIGDWTPERHREIERRLGLQVEIESLGLEEIFLELHR